MISPVVGLTVATSSSSEVKVPPEVPSEVNVVVPPIQIELVPESVPADTFGLTVTSLVDDTGPPQPVTV